jgi:serine/threonine protein kinase
MSPEPERFDAKSLQESESSRSDFGPVSWRLLGLANVDRRDVVDHSDRVRYTAIGIFMVLFTMYAIAGWIAFLSSAGLRSLGSVGLAVEIVGALFGAGATLAFDRVLVGTTKPKLDYEFGEVTDAGESSRSGSPATHDHEGFLPSLVAKSSRGPIAARLLIALVIGVFVTQAVDLKVFAGDIDSQRADDQVGTLRREQRETVARHAAEVKQHEASVRLVTRQFKEATIREAQAKSGSHGICEQHLFHSTAPSRCHQATESELAASAELTTLAEEDPTDPATTVGRRYFTRNAEIVKRIAVLLSDPRASRSAGGGPASDTADLIRYVVDNPGSIPLCGAVLILALLLDLAAIMLKLAGFDSQYERRQALRAWMLLTSVIATESIRFAQWQIGVRNARREQAVREAAAREAAKTAIERNEAEERAYRAAYARLDRNPKVQRDADRVAADEMARKMRARAPFLRDDDSRFGDPQPDYEPPISEDEPRSEEEGASFAGFMTGDVLKGASGTGWRLVRSHDKHVGGHSTVWEAERITREGQDLGGIVRVAIKLMPVDEGGPFNPPSFDVRSERARNELHWLQQFPRDAKHLPWLLDKSPEPFRGVSWHATAWASSTLHDYYVDKRDRPLADILEFARQIVIGLIEAQLVHRDLKPTNILCFEQEKGVTAPGSPRLVVNDWGLARPFGERPDVSHHEIGTIDYAAPDTVDPMRRVHAADDLFSVGAIMWWGITGKAPGFARVARPISEYESLGAFAAALARACEDLPTLQSVQPNVPHDVSTFVGRLLSPHRNARLLRLSDLTRYSHQEFLEEAHEMIRNLQESLDYEEESLGAPVMVGPGMGSGTPFGDTEGWAREGSDPLPETNPTGRFEQPPPHDRDGLGSRLTKRLRRNRERLPEGESEDASVNESHDESPDSQSAGSRGSAEPEQGGEPA